MKKDKEQRNDLDSFMEEINKEFGAGTLMTLNKAPRVNVDVISTGSFSLDRALGVGGFPRGRIIEIYGPESCLDSETFVQYGVWTEEGKRSNHKGGTIERLFERFHHVKSTDERGKNKSSMVRNGIFTAPCMDENGAIFHNRIVDVIYTGTKRCLKLRTSSGLTILATPEHKFFEGGRYVQMADLKLESEIFIHNNTPYEVVEEQEILEEKKRSHIYVRFHPIARKRIVSSMYGPQKYTYYQLQKSRAVCEARLNGLTLDEYLLRLDSSLTDGLKFLQRNEHVHHLDEDFTNNESSNLVVLSASDHSRYHALKNQEKLRFVVVPDKIVSLEDVGLRKTYDLRMESPFNNYVANGFVVHNSGKTTLALNVIAQAQKLGGKAAFIDAEHALDPDYAQRIGVKLDGLAINQPDSGEDALNLALKLITSGTVDVIVIDSVAALTPKSELEGDIGKNQVGAQARMMGQALRKMTALAAKNNVMVIFINQLRMKIGVMFGNPETTPGGMALKFYCAVRIEIRRTDKIKDKDDIVGNNVKVKVVKNKVSVPFKVAEFSLIFGEGIDFELDVLGVALKDGVVRKEGNTLMFGDLKLGMLGNARKALKADPALVQKLIDAMAAPVFTQVGEPIAETGIFPDEKKVEEKKLNPAERRKLRREKKKNEVKE